MTPEVGVNQYTMGADIVSTHDGHGNSKSYTLDRLKREAPKPRLAASVLFVPFIAPRFFLIFAAETA